MICEMNTTLFEEVLEPLQRNGTTDLERIVEILLNEAMTLERSRHLKAAPYERTDDRRGYSNGFKNKRLRTKVGELSLSVPPVRDSNFYPSSLEKGVRTERALLLALAERYVQGTSTRKVSKIVEELCGFEVNSSEVSRATK